MDEPDYDDSELINGALRTSIGELRQQLLQRLGLGEELPTLDQVLGGLSEDERTTARSQVADLLDSLAKIQTAGEVNPVDDGDSQTPSLATRTFVGSTNKELSNVVNIGEAHLDQSGESKIPLTLGRYQVERLLGEGSFGVVYLAHDLDLDRHVAIKVIRESFRSTTLRESFLREARVLASLEHPHILPVLDVGYTPDSRTFIVSKYLDGSDLNQRNRRQPLDYLELAKVLLQISEALKHAHSRGIVHRDIKPANILLDKDGYAYLCDFGLAMRDGDVENKKYLVGTPAFMSPEQARGDSDSLDGRTDIYSLGATMYQLMCGRTTFNGSALELIQKVTTQQVRPPRQWNPEIPSELEQICLKCLAFDISQRYSSAAELIEDLSNFIKLPQPNSYENGAKQGLRQLPSKEVSTVKELPFRAWNSWHVLNEKARDFTGRTWLYNEIQEWLARKSAEPMLLLQADPGYGKSAFAAWLICNRPRNLIAHHFFQADTPASLEPWRVVQSLSSMLYERLPEYRHQVLNSKSIEFLEDVNCRADPASALEFGILAPLHAIDSTEFEEPCFLLLDALDEALLCSSGPTFPALLETRLRRLPKWLRILATSRHERLISDMFPWALVRVLSANETSNQSDMMQYARNEVERQGLHVADMSLGTERLIEQLTTCAAGNFLYLQQAVRGIERGTYQLEELSGMPHGLDDLFHVGFRRMFPTADSFRLAQLVLETICAAVVPLDEMQLADISGVKIDIEMPTILEKLLAYLTFINQPGELPKIALFHKSLYDWLTTPSRRQSLHFVSLRRGQERITEYSCKHSTTDYSLRYLARHLIEQQDQQRVFTLLTDFSYLRVKIEEGYLLDLLKELSAAAAMPRLEPDRQYLLQILRSALVKNLHFIEKWPHSWYQVIINECLWLTSANLVNPQTVPSCLEGQANLEIVIQFLKRLRDSSSQESPRSAWLRSLLPPPEPLTTSPRLLLRGHQLPLRTVCFSHDGNVLISGANDIRLWSLAEGQHLSTINAHETSIPIPYASPSCKVLVAVPLDSDRLASLGTTGRVLIHQWTTGMMLSEITYAESRFTCITSSADGCWLALVTQNRHLQLRATNSFDIVWEVQGISSSILSLNFSADGVYIVGGASDGSVTVWRACDGELVTRIQAHSGRILQVFCSGNSGLLVSASLDNTVNIHRVGSWNHLSCLKHLPGVIFCIALSKNHQVLAVGLNDGCVLLFDTLRGVCCGKFLGHVGPVNALAFSADGKRLASGGDDLTVRVWDMMSAPKNASVAESLAEIHSLSMDPNGTCLALGRTDGSLEVRDLTTGLRRWRATSVADQEDEQTGVQTRVGVAVSPDSHVVAAGALDRSASAINVFLYDAQNGQELQRFALLQNFSTESIDLKFSSTGDDLLVSQRNKAAVLSNSPISIRFIIPKQHVWLITLIPLKDIIVFATVNKGGVMDLWDTRTRRIIGCVQDVGKNLEKFLVTSDIKTAIVGYVDGSLRQLDFVSNGNAHIIGQVDSAITCLEWSPSKKLFAVGTELGGVFLWSVDGLQMTLPEQGAAIIRLAFSPNGDWLLSLDRNGALRIDSLNQSGLGRQIDTGKQRLTNVDFICGGNVVVGLAPRILLRWTQDSLQPLSPLEAPPKTQFRLMSITRNGLRVALVCRQIDSPSNDAIRVFDASHSNDFQTWEVGEAVESMQFDDTGQVLLVYTQDGLLQFRDAQTGSISCEYSIRPQLDVDGFSISQEEKMIVADNGGVATRAWSLSTGMRHVANEILGEGLNGLDAPREGVSAISMLPAPRGIRSRTTLFFDSNGQNVLAYPAALRNLISAESSFMWAGSEGPNAYVLKWEKGMALPISKLPHEIGTWLKKAAAFLRS